MLIQCVCEFILKKTYWESSCIRPPDNAIYASPRRVGMSKPVARPRRTGRTWGGSELTDDGALNFDPYPHDCVQYTYVYIYICLIVLTCIHIRTYLYISIHIYIYIIWRFPEIIHLWMDFQLKAIHSHLWKCRCMVIYIYIYM